MIGARPIQDLTRGLGRNAFDLPVAALAGLAAAVIAFAMPADLLGRLVSATGLPHLLAAAEPPLGFKARAMLGLAGAGAAFALAYGLMRLLDRAGKPKARPECDRFDEDRPRLRRRDLHPDAPACRPISAARDFGEPAPPTLAPPEPPVPAWFAEPEPQLEAAEEPAPAPTDEAEPPLELTDRPTPAWLAEPQAEPEPEFEAAPLPVPELEPEAAAPPPRSDLADASLPELMRRLEQGLARRRSHRFAFPAAPHPPHAPPPQVFPEAHDDRLQSAIDSLQRFAARGD
jgi:hypothetical protein